MYLHLLSAIRYSSLQPFSLPHAYKDNKGRKRQTGLKHLPGWLHETFHNQFIRYIIEQVCSSDKPWSGPTLAILQHELNHTYPTHQIRLHSNDAAVVLVNLVANVAGVSNFSWVHR